MTHYLIMGGSGGLGAHLMQYLPRVGDHVWVAAPTAPLLSATDGIERVWIPVDLGQRGAGTQIAAHIGDQPLDVCLYHADLTDVEAQTATEETHTSIAQRLIALHLTAVMMSIQKLLPNLRRSPQARIVFMGAPPPLVLPASDEALRSMPHFELKQVSHALREMVRRDRIGVTCLFVNEVDDGSVTGAVPPTDLVALLRCIISLSSAATVNELNLSVLAN